MADYTREEFLQLVLELLPDNIRREITEARLREIINNLTNVSYDALDFAFSSSTGINKTPITPTSSPSSNTGIWIATEDGTYTNFGGVTVPEGNIGFIFGNNGNFTISTIELPTQPVDQTLNPNSSNAIANSAVADDLEFVKSLETESLQLFDPSLIELGGWLASNGNPYTSTEMKRSKSITITVDMLGANSISGFGPVGSTLSRVCVKSASGALLLSIPSQGSDLKDVQFDLSNDMLGANLRFTIGNNSSEPTNGYENTFMWNKGNSALPFQKFGTFGFDIEKVPTISSFNQSKQPINEDAVKEYVGDLNFLKESDLDVTEGKNKFDKSTVSVGYMQLDGATFPTSTGYRYSEPIPIENGVTYYGKGVGQIANRDGMRFITALDENKNVLPLQGINGGSNSSVYTFNFPSSTNVKYVVISIYEVTLDTFQLEEGSSATDYEPYGDQLNGVLGYKINSSTTPPVTAKLNLICEGDSTTEGADLGTQAERERDRWTTLLQTALGNNYNVVNRGTSGARAEEIISRVSARNPRVVVTSGTITSNARNPLTYNDIEPLRAGATGVTYTYPAVLMDYNGIVARGYMTKLSTNSGFYSLESSNISVGSKELYLVSTANKYLTNGVDLNENDLYVVGMGANNVPLITNNTQTVDYLKQTIKDLFQSYPNVMFWGQTDRGVSELTIINEVEDYCFKEFGTKFCPVRRYLASNQSIVDAKKINSSFVETQDDLDRIAQGSIPPSLKYSSTSAHLNALGHQLQMNFIKNWLIQYYL